MPQVIHYFRFFYQMQLLRLACFRQASQLQKMEMEAITSRIILCEAQISFGFRLLTGHQKSFLTSEVLKIQYISKDLYQQVVTWKGYQN